MSAPPRLVSNLRWWNVVVAIVHLSSFTALTVIAFTRLDQARLVPLWVDYGATVDVLGQYVLFATLLPFPLITGLFHIYATVDPRKTYSREVLLQGRNTLRWIEYAITNGLMSWSVAVVAGANNLILPITCVLSNCVMQYFGYLHETINQKLKQPGKTWGPLLVGFVPWLINWLIALLYFGFRIGRESVQVTDYLAVFGTFVWSLGFVAPLVWRFNKPGIVPNYKVEVAYALLSLSAKLWLDWVLTIGNLVE